MLTVSRRPAQDHAHFGSFAVRKDCRRRGGVESPAAGANRVSDEAPPISMAINFSRSSIRMVAASPAPFGGAAAFSPRPVRFTESEVAAHGFAK